MNVAVVPDKYKGCLSSEQVGESMMAGVHDVFPDALCRPFYVSDGGDGFLETIRRYVEGVTIIEMRSTDAYGREIDCRYLWSDTTKTAYVELAETVGLAKLGSAPRDLSQATTRGMGKQMVHAMNKGAKCIVMGLGGSATNDGGMGLLAEIGFTFFDDKGRSIDPIPFNFSDIVTVVPPAGSFGEVEFVAIYDVNNPLLGVSGATYTYALQKGAKESDLPQLETYMSRLSSLDGLNHATTVSEYPGSGAAGGTAFGLKAGLDARFEPGALFLLRLSGFEDLLRSGEADVVLTGEGKMDGQTTYGKLINGVIELATANQVPVLAVCGKIEEVSAGSLGLLDMAEISDPTKPVSYSFDHAADLIRWRTRELLEKYRDQFIGL